MELRRFRLLLDPLSPFGTPPTSGTLFGHLCWAKRAREGREALRAWLARLPAEPLALSDLLPADHLPRPLLPPALKQAPEEDAKALKRRRYLPLEAWRGLRIGATARALEAALRKQRDDPPFLKPARSPHNRIDRASGKTPEAGGGGLWFADELWPAVGREGPRRIAADLYVQSALPAGELEALLADLGATGFGRDASTGRGRFTLEGSEAAGWLAEAPKGGGAARMLSLSQGVVSANMQAARWQRFVLFGKLGRAMAAEGKRPWKLPLVLAEAGATFAPEGAGPFGAWITGLHQDEEPGDPIGHNAFHLAIPYTEAAA
ncbi:MAG: type III-A CRISPR-associated RAMP protein Csm4 [Roseococcus sp.]